MEDKERYARLYDKMNRIKIKTSHLIDNIENLEEDLKEYIVINNKPLESKNISNNKKKLREIKNTVKYDIVSNIKNYF